jgi:Fe-S-cluster-containing hydrogenase component 2
MTIKIVPARCPANHPCPAVRACPVDALTQVGYGVPTVNAQSCIDCGKCTRVCPTGALRPQDK